MNFFNKIALLSLGLILMMDASVVAPILPKIAENYPALGPQAIKLIITLPVIFIVIFNPISGRLMNYINRKFIVLLGLVLFTLGGVAGAYAPTFSIMLFLRAIMGIGLGLISPHVLGTVQALSSGEERIRLTGFVTGLNNLGIIFANITAGILATTSWKAPFKIYGIGIPLFILILLFFPKTEIPKRDKGSRNKVKLGSYLSFFIFVAIMVSVIFNTLLLNFATFMSQSNLGESSEIGILMSIVTFISFICGFTYKYFVNFFKDKLFLVSSGALFSGFLILGTTSNIKLIVAALLTIGIGIGLAYPLLFTSVGKITSKEEAPFVIALVTSTLYIGRFVCPVLVDNLGVILKMNPLRFPFFFSAFSAALAFFFYFPLRSSRRKKISNMEKTKEGNN